MSRAIKVQASIAICRGGGEGDRRGEAGRVVVKGRRTCGGVRVGPAQDIYALGCCLEARCTVTADNKERSVAAGVTTLMTTDTDRRGRMLG